MSPTCHSNCRTRRSLPSFGKGASVLPSGPFRHLRAPPHTPDERRPPPTPPLTHTFHSCTFHSFPSRLALCLAMIGAVRPSVHPCLYPSSSVDASQGPSHTSVSFPPQLGHPCPPGICSVIRGVPSRGQAVSRCAAHTCWGTLASTAQAPCSGAEEPRRPWVSGFFPCPREVSSESLLLRVCVCVCVCACGCVWRGGGVEVGVGEGWRPVVDFGAVGGSSGGRGSRVGTGARRRSGTQRIKGLRDHDVTHAGVLRVRVPVPPGVCERPSRTMGCIAHLGVAAWFLPVVQKGRISGVWVE